jgi:hypothetical protein
MGNFSTWRSKPGLGRVSCFKSQREYSAPIAIHHILLDHQKVSKSQREYSSPDRHGRKVGVVYWFQIPTGNFSTTFLCLATSKIIQFQIPMGKSKLYYYAKFSRWTTEFQIPMGSPKLVCFLKRQS